MGRERCHALATLSEWCERMQFFRYRGFASFGSAISINVDVSSALLPSGMALLFRDLFRELVARQPLIVVNTHTRAGMSASQPCVELNKRAGEQVMIRTRPTDLSELEKKETTL